MKKSVVILIGFVFKAAIGVAQEEPVPDPQAWQIGTDVNFYFFPDDFFVLPIVRADKNKLHMEARYNYEDRQTFSGWIGYNLKGGNKLEYLITPMVGGVVGLSNGIAPGLEMTLTLKRFELYSESENYFAFGSRESNFFYNWTDLTYSATDWLWFGLSGQRTRLYQTALEIQRGVLIGAGFKDWELAVYVYNVGFDDPFVLLTLSKTF